MPRARTGGSGLTSLIGIRHCLERAIACTFGGDCADYAHVVTAPETTTDARRTLFAGLIDHAPTFPPAQLPLAEGLAEHRRVRDGDTGWIVNRFVCPASKLAELGDETLRLSVVLDEGGLPEADERIEAVEAAGIDPEVMIDAAPEVYCELPLLYDVSFRILQLGELGIRAKVRCGGATTPRVPDLAGFVAACRRLGVPFKATAGLHHPVRTATSTAFSTCSRRRPSTATRRRRWPRRTNPPSR